MLGLTAHAQLRDGKELVRASLVADTSAIAPGMPFRAGLLLKMEPGWHTYYKDPGDSGLPTKITWTLPPGFKAGEIQWPKPKPHLEAGDLKTNIYEEEVLLTIPITVPAQLPPEPIRLEAAVSWLTCSDLCVPGKATLVLELPVSPKPTPANGALFAKYPPERSDGMGAPAHKTAGGFWLNLLFGFIGGLLLNVMPCVLPVIALKIMGFVQQAGAEPGKTFRLGLAFVAGIFVWFLGLAGLLVLFKHAGREVNWAFQFQNPWFVGVAFILVLVFALNMLGAFELLLPQKANERLMKWVAHEGYGGAFLHGVFATLLATPCTAPFLGPALGFALSQRPAVIFTIFGAIAAGMSLPYFLLTAKPAWLKLLPKPGIWMVRVKQFMGVLLLGTALWLGWIVWLQQTKAVDPEPFPVRLARAVDSGKPVFVDFTADWCVNCKVNERLVLKTTAVQEAFRKHDVQFLVADWTRGEPAITALLKQFNRAGVPLYVYYPGSGKPPVVFPELITKEIILNAVNGK